MLASLSIQEQLDLLPIVDVPPRHIRVLWGGVEKLPFSFANKMDPGGKFVALSCDIIAGSTPPTVAIDPD